MRKFIGLLVFSLVGLFLFTGVSVVAPDVVEFILKKNEHIKQTNEIGQIIVDKTPIDYPIYQHPSDDTYYLNHDGQGDVTYYGAIFMELVNQADFSDPMVVLYGHAMRDEAMFGSLHHFLKASYMDEHSTIEIQLPHEKRVYAVFAAYEENDTHLFSQYDWSNQTAVNQHRTTIEQIVQSKGGVYKKVDSAYQQLLTLSTCDVTDDERIIIQAILIQINKEI